MRMLRVVAVLSGLLFGALAAVAAATKIRHRSSGDDESDELDLVTIWGGTEIASRARSFRGGETLTWWGGTRIDLRDAQLDEDGATLQTRTLFGGIEIVVPADWPLITDVRTFAGGVDGPETGAAPAGGSPKMLYVTGWVAFGGVSIAYEPSGGSGVKEREPVAAL